MAQKTTRDTSFNYYKIDNTVFSVVSQNASGTYKNVKLLDVDDGVVVTGQKIKDHAANNHTMKDLGYLTPKINTDNIVAGQNYVIYGAPFQVVLNNRQHYNNCGVESTLNNLAMAGKVIMSDKLSDQQTVETEFLQGLWELGYAADDDEVGVLDKGDGGTLPDNYRDVFEHLDIESKAYYYTKKCDDTQFSDLNDLALKISQGYGAVLGVCSKVLWQDQKSETGELGIDHAITITGVVYAEGATPGIDAPKGFYIHDTGAWMTRYISLDEFKEVTLYDYHGMNPDEKDKYWNYDDTPDKYDPKKYIKNLRELDTTDRQYVGKQPGGLTITLTSEPIKTDMFNLNTNGNGQNNILMGNSGENKINGLGGNDSLYGNAGDDEIKGGNGNDIIIGNNLSKADKINLADNYGITLSDVITSETMLIGDNLLYGEGGNDIILGGSQFDLIYGGNGNDFIWTGEGRNAAYGEKGNDFIVGGSDTDRLFGDAGNDIIYGLGDDDVISGGDGNDSIFGGRGNDGIETGKGSDVVYFEGSMHGIDNVFSKAGKTTLKFVDEVNGNSLISKAVDISDIEFDLAKDEKTGGYNLEMSHESDLETRTDGILFKNICNKNGGGLKELYLEDEDTTYKVNVSKATTIRAKAENNIIISFGEKGKNVKGTTITTSLGNDIVTMLQTAETSDNYATKVDSITYTGGMDKYVSEERDTYYTVQGFDEDTVLAILDNAAGLTKYSPEGLEIKNVVSTDDRLYLDCDQNNLQFFFDVGINNKGEAITTENTGFFVFDSSSMTKNKFVATATDNEVSGLIAMGAYFDDNEVFTDYDFYGNGKIESIYCNDTLYNQDTLTHNLADIASSVAGWLATEGYNTAFDAFNDWNNIDVNAQNALVACYGYEVPMA
ncbi:hypothetical protein IJI31_02515 [bacterium]|nr:hypothetical protein [bacterium]